MATDVVGMAKMVVEGTLARAQTAIEVETKQQQSVQDDLVFITGEFQMMQSFLAATDEERARNDVVRSWVRQVRELAYDVEDCIEFVVDLDKKSAWRPRMLPPWWPRMLPSWWPRMLPSCVAPSLAIDEAAEDIKRLKARVEDVSHRSGRYKLVTGSGSKPAVASQTAAGVAPFDVVQEARDFARKNRGAVDLTELVADKSDRSLLVISLWGTGGDLGMAPTIKMAYDDASVHRGFGFRGWVKLARPFNLDDFLRCLLTQSSASASSGQQRQATTSEAEKTQAHDQGQEHLVKDFARQVEGKRYLVVVENVSTVQEWEAIQACLPDKNNASRVVLSTAQLEVATQCTPQPWGVSELAHLSADHSICVFYSKEGRPGTSIPKEAIEEVKNSNYFNNLKWTKATKDVTFQKMKLALDWEGIVGREKESDSLDNMFRSTERYGIKVVSVWGIAGSGKSALARDLYYRKVKELGFAQCGWVDVPPQPFDLRELSRSLLQDLYSDSFHAKDTGCFGVVLSDAFHFDKLYMLPPEKKEEAMGAFVDGKRKYLQCGTLGFVDPVDECRRLLHQGSCLLVIDGLRSTEEWDLIKAAFVDAPGREDRPVQDSCIMVVTTEESLAAYCAMQDKRVQNVKGLGAAESIRLFREEIEKNRSFNQVTFDMEFEEQAKLLVEKCGGLPQVIVAVGASVDATKLIAAKKWIRELNDNFMPELETNPRFGNLQGIFTWMHSYFRTCPDYLKPCIFYLSIFPGGSTRVRRRRMVGRWIAEGYSRDQDGRTAEERAEMFFSELLGLSIIQQPPETATETYIHGTMGSIQINGFFREYIRSRQMEDNLVFELKGRCSIGAARCSRGRHLAVRASWDRDKNVYDAIDFSRLRSLTVFGEWRPFLVSDRMKLLRVLDLEDTSDLEDDGLEQAVKLVPRLKFLSLRGCRGIRRLPDSIGDLTQLETLDARDTCVATLPTAIARLPKLQYLRAGAVQLDTPASAPPAPLLPKDDGQPTPSWTPCPCPRPLPKIRLRRQPRPRVLAEPRVGVEMPRGGLVWQTTSLHTLGVVDVAAARHGLAVLKELKNFTQLRKLGVSGINPANIMELLSSISGHGHLQSLSVRLDDDAVAAGDSSNGQNPYGCSDFSPPEKLQSLKLYYGIAPEKLPPWINKLHNLSKLHLHMAAMLSEDDIYVLADLPNLRVLRLCLQPVQDCNLHFRHKPEVAIHVSFNCLRILEIACNSKLQQVIFGADALRFLEVLKVRCTDGSLSLQFVELVNLSRIQRIFLKDCEAQIVDNMKTEFGKLLRNPKPVLELEFCNAPKLEYRAD